MDELNAAAEGQGNGFNLEDALDTTPLEAMGLSVRAYNALKRHLVRTKGGKLGYMDPTVGQLSKLTHKELCSIRNLGERSVAEVEEALFQQYGIRLR